MFTGIIDHIGKIVEFVRQPQQAQAIIQTQFSDLKLGESIAVDGICLTVTAIENNTFQCTLSPETLQRTTAHTWHSDKNVNLERALQLHDRLGGHFVLGHVDKTIQILKKEILTEYVALHFGKLDETDKQYILPKGSVCLNGVSLTINHVTAEEFTVMLIPHTLAITNLQELAVGDSVNLEYDYIARIIAWQQPSLSQLS